MHTSLTVKNALTYTAMLRLPPDTRKAALENRINDVLAIVDMADQKDMQISSLSGGQRKRVSTASEMLSEPRLPFLDEDLMRLRSEACLQHVKQRLQFVSPEQTRMKVEAWKHLAAQDAVLIGPSQLVCSLNQVVPARFPLLRQQTSTPIAMGELYVNVNEYLPLVQNRLIDFMRVHLSDIGGLTPARQCPRGGRA